MEVRRAVVAYLGGQELSWPRPVRHHQPVELPLHLPVLVQAYADQLELPWVALHGGRLLGAHGVVTPKHRRGDLRQVYRLAPGTRVALELFVDDQVLEGVWARRRQLLEELAELQLDLILAPNFSVWRDASRLCVIWNQVIGGRRVVGDAVASRVGHSALTSTVGEELDEVQLERQDVSAPSCRPDEFETVSHHKHNQEGVPDRAEPLELHYRCDQGNDRQNTPAQAGDDAMGFTASSKVGEAVGAVDAADHAPNGSAVSLEMDQPFRGFGSPLARSRSRAPA
jgi:hypothetical protein